MEEWGAAIGAGGDKLELTGSVNAVVEGHGAGEYTLDGAGRKRMALVSSPLNGDMFFYDQI